VTFGDDDIDGMIYFFINHLFTEKKYIKSEKIRNKLENEIIC
jgi:hypothetical protein